MRHVKWLLIALMLVLVSANITQAAPRPVSTYPAGIDWNGWAGGCIVKGEDFCTTIVAWLEKNGGLSVFGLPIDTCPCR